jgi:hypothetical protein
MIDYSNGLQDIMDSFVKVYQQRAKMKSPDFLQLVGVLIDVTDANVRALELELSFFDSGKSPNPTDAPLLFVLKNSASDQSISKLLTDTVIPSVFRDLRARLLAFNSNKVSRSRKSANAAPYAAEIDSDFESPGAIDRRRLKRRGQQQDLNSQRSQILAASLFGNDPGALDGDSQHDSEHGQIFGNTAQAAHDDESGTDDLRSLNGHSTGHITDDNANSTQDSDDFVTNYHSASAGDTADERDGGDDDLASDNHQVADDDSRAKGIAQSADLRDALRMLSGPERSPRRTGEECDAESNGEFGHTLNDAALDSRSDNGDSDISDDSASVCPCPSNECRAETVLPADVAEHIISNWSSARNGLVVCDTNIDGFCELFSVIFLYCALQFSLGYLALWVD